MKRLLLVLLVLGLSVPAIANVFVYNYKESGVEFGYNADANAGAGAWVVPPKSSHTTYIVIQADSNSPDSVNLWSIDTWKEKDPDTGETHKYYTVDGLYTINFLETTIAKKKTWIAEGILSDSYSTHIMLSGQTKLTKIGSQPYTVAAALSGYTIYGNIANEDVGGGPVSLTLNTTITKVLVSSDDDVAGAIDTYFQGFGYEPG